MLKTTKLLLLAATIMLSVKIYAQSMPSGTLPIMYICTENRAPIESKDVYLNATYYIAAPEDCGVESVGSADAQLPLEIRGRGNYTWWGFDKKPYRLKLGDKKPLLGMKKSKHFALLAHADDEMAFLRNTIGFELSRRLNLPYTPAQEPIEVVLNDNYIGLYMLTETIRVDADRVNIIEQEDNATDAEAVTGGWLVEIDNYDDPAQIKLTEGNGATLRITYKTPEALSVEQKNYLTNQIKEIDKAVYESDSQSTTLTSLLDIDDLTRFYILNEIMDNGESFHGSCYMYKDKGTDTKWHFGPVWDFGNSFRRGAGKFIYVDPPFGQTWISEIAKFDSFNNAVKDYWNIFYNSSAHNLDEFIDNFIDKIKTAVVSDRTRWQGYGTENVESAVNRMKNLITERISWLNGYWYDSSVETPSESTEITIKALGNGQVELQTTEQIVKIEAFDISGGRLLDFNSSVSDTKWQLSLPEGVVIIKLTDNCGNTIIRKTAVK